jgi:PKD repeat protein
MKAFKIVSLVLLLSLLLPIPAPLAANSQPLGVSGIVSQVNQPSAIGDWQTGPFPPDNFQYARHDAAFVPGPALETWANKVYFMGGRTSPPTEAPHIWMFDPLTGSYTDTGADVVEDVSNYNSNLILDDGTGRGPAVYVIGGTDKDHGGINIGTVQRYYPMTNECEALPQEDNFNSMVGVYRVAAMGTAVVGDIIYVYGGWETTVAPYFTGATWAFDPNQPSGSRWTQLSTYLSVPRSYIMSAVQDGKIYAIGGVGIYVGGELDPVATVEMLDTANLLAGWTLLAAMPAPGGEGRAFGFDSDTLLGESPYQGKLYVVAPNDWPGVSGEVLEYDVISDTWRSDLPELPTPRADLAATFVPLCTADPDDGLPGLWTFGGRINESCDPPLGPVEYASMTCETLCTGLTEVAINGPEQLVVGETGFYSATILPVDASAPVSLLWSNSATTPETSYTWDVGGLYTVVITGTNCDGVSIVTDTYTVTVLDTPITGLSAANDSPTVLGFTTTLTAAVESGTNVVYHWDLGDGTTAEGALVGHVYPAAGVYTAVVTATNNQGSQVAQTSVTVEEAISGLAASNDSPTMLGLTTTLTAAVESGTNVNYSWDLGDGTTAEGAVASHVYPVVGVYTAVVTATNEFGWQSETTTVIVEQPESIFYYYLPFVIHKEPIAALAEPY